MQHCFVGLPQDKTGNSVKTYLYRENRKTKALQVLWGDWLNVDGEEADGWLRVIWAPKNAAKRQTLYIPKAHTSGTRPLEVVFLDVGQGDGCVLITPERGEGEAVIVIDAGISEHMSMFLKGRFKSYKDDAFRFHAAVLTHPDEDHYGGFEQIFGNKGFGFKHVYHNGLVERPVKGTFDKIGGLKADPQTGIKYAEDLALGRQEIEQHFGGGADPGRFLFPKVMRAALENPNVGNFSMLSTEHGQKEDGRTWLPGFAPSDGRLYQIEVLGPVAEPDAAGKPRLRKLGSYGETKNGHSVLLRLHYKKFKVLFGGDLNEKAEKFLLTRYTGRSRFPPEDSGIYDEMIMEARNWFSADLMKVCHHGSEKVTDAFLQAVNPGAFVISSGDEEGHVHPRPDLLGRLGRTGRGKRPVILSTELQRSTREAEDEKLVRGLTDKVLKLAESPTEKLRNKIIDDIWVLGRSNVSVYGSIYVKTDGDRLIAAFRIESGSEVKKWFTFDYAFDENGVLHLMS
ncbi:ComEC/Rec2 family competence protein [Roseibium litorale]|uniref:MBL fold metallo-hydrolase n=1 Tax=Roseibium litorale TaxID=2803841 RepID=A0ABR9CNH0_9HYPH|nr:MBL fold metallo-hydrolase [Roseibium litorale]MBD8891837.1 MBL fold metallo-hydrolase [Roseibium litorale]